MMLLFDLGLLAAFIAGFFLVRLVRDRRHLAKVWRTECEVVGMSVVPASFRAIDPATGRPGPFPRRTKPHMRYSVTVSLGAGSHSFEVDELTYKRFTLRGTAILIHRTHRRGGKIVPLDVFPCFDS